jgi:hypothetical protein
MPRKEYAVKVDTRANDADIWRCDVINWAFKIFNTRQLTCGVSRQIWPRSLIDVESGEIVISVSRRRKLHFTLTRSLVQTLHGYNIGNLLLMGQRMPTKGR